MEIRDGSYSQATKTDERSEKTFKRVGSFSIQNFILQILNLYIGLVSEVSGKKLQYNFPNMRRGGTVGEFRE